MNILKGTDRLVSVLLVQHFLRMNTYFCMVLWQEEGYVE
jgi:hypothetical protein